MILEPSPGFLRWRQRKWWSRLSLQMYVAGITSGGIHSSAPGGWIVSNHYRGKRPYILWLKREEWGYPLHFLRYHHWPRNVWGFCGVCAPWQCCGAVGFDHAEDCEECA